MRVDTGTERDYPHIGIIYTHKDIILGGVGAAGTLFSLYDSRHTLAACLLACTSTFDAPAIRTLTIQ